MQSDKSDKKENIINTISITEQIEKYVKERNSGGVRKILSGMHPSDIADLIESLEIDNPAFILESLDPEIAAEVFFELDIDKREELLADLDAVRIARIVEEMDSDDATDLIGELPKEKAEAVLSHMDPEEVKEVKPLLKYPEDTAGGLMQTELVKVTADTKVIDAINWIRLIADDVEEFHGIFVVDEQDRLLGFVPLSKLIIANPKVPVSEIMEPVEATLTPYMDQEEVAEIFRKYDAASLPVVDEDGKLLGRVTYDDILDVISEEAEEDMYHLAGVGEHLHPIFTPTLERIKLRFPWLLITLLGELLIAFIIIHTFQATLEKVAILAAFMPAIMAMGGNVGVQTSAIMIRSIGLGTVSSHQIIKLILSEVKVGIALGSICGFLAAILALLIGYNQPEIYRVAFAVFVAMISATTSTSLIGVTVPLILHKMNYDPAAASGPFLSLFNDMFGSVVYLVIATLMFS